MGVRIRNLNVQFTKIVCYDTAFSIRVRIRKNPCITPYIRSLARDKSRVIPQDGTEFVPGQEFQFKSLGHTPIGVFRKFNPRVIHENKIWIPN